nr:immunoglobulin light chain junction region [Macaca mulatta]MOW40830.1 immunoglobulin light chain junction region [Macaca mulatta]MOW40863.1 immunoglobulin light chain junction region [Macaca mulatta]MOW40969.1 immunoglobulin light chain junction region [Macaca mulatta]MOW41028.1 immunoglobulin light chain junction region [Macaca mulatta]
CQQYDSDPYNF